MADIQLDNENPIVATLQLIILISMGISLSRNIAAAQSFEDLRQQVGEFVSTLEDYLNSNINIYIIERAKQPRPSFNKGDLVFDLTIKPGFATLQQWNGTKLIFLNFSSIAGLVNLVTQGIGSGINPTLFLRSDGAGGWVLAAIPPPIFPTTDTADIVATANIAALQLITAGGAVANSSNVAHFNRVVGIVMIATLSGFIATATVEGEVTDGSWGWTPNVKLFLNGTALSTVPPSSGFSQLVGLTRNSNTVFIRLLSPILL